MGIDPGTATMGIGCLESDCESDKLTVAQAFTAIAKDNDPTYSTIAYYHGSRTGRLMNLSDQLLNVITEYKPHAVVVENNYLRASVEAFRALVESVCMVRNTLYQYDSTMPLYTVDPSTVKKLAGVKGKIKGDDKKTAVLEALRARDDLIWQVDINAMDEHSVDATAIALYFMKRLLAIN